MDNHEQREWVNKDTSFKKLKFHNNVMSEVFGRHLWMLEWRHWFFYQ
jgi:hypothetical protein